MTVVEATRFVTWFEEEIERRGEEVFLARGARRHAENWDIGDAWHEFVRAAQTLKARTSEVLGEIERERGRGGWPINCPTRAPVLPRAPAGRMTFEDACNVVAVTGDDVAKDAEVVRLDDLNNVREAASALAAYVAEYETHLDREHARVRAAARPDAPWVEGHPLAQGVDGGGRRHYLGDEPVHAGTGLYLLTDVGWLRVRYEFDHATRTPVIYFGVPGGESVLMRIPTGARFAWPHEVRPSSER